MKAKFLGAVSAIFLMGSAQAHDHAAPTAQDQFFANLTALCGKSFAGTKISTDPKDADFAGKPLIMHVKSCTDNEIRVPFHVGDDHSRTWVITRTQTGLHLSHDHRHKDGSEDTLSRYGGATIAQGQAARQEFPADDYSKSLFVKQEIPVSVDNIWAFELYPDRTFIYELRRPNRDFRVSFDLSKPLG